MINLFLDTEFTSLEIDDAKIISIALISEDGARSFYAEITDTYHEDDCSDFVKEVVLPLLDAPSRRGHDFLNVYEKMTHIKAARELDYWLENIKDDVAIWTDAPDYDWKLFCALLGYAVPHNVSTKPMQIEMNDLYKEEANRLFALPTVRQHHALDDAEVMAKAWVTTRT